MRHFFTEIFEYTYHSNDKIIDLLLEKEFPDKSLKLLNHILNAHEIWNSRIEGITIKTSVWEVRASENLKKINTNNFNLSKKIIETYDLDKKIIYRNSKGDQFENSIKDMLFHVVNHSTYHRGQIASNLKEHGIEPLVTDYIFYKRTNF